MLSAQHPLNTTVHASGWTHSDRRSSAPHLPLSFISNAHFWLFLPVKVSRDVMEKPFPTQAPQASVGLAELWSLAQGDRVIILVRQIILCNTYFECLPPGMIHSLSRGEETLLRNNNNSKDVNGIEHRGRRGKDSSKVLALSSLLLCCCFHHIQLKGNSRSTKES